MELPPPTLQRTKSALLQSGVWTPELQARIEEFEQLCILQIRSEPIRTVVVEYLETVAPIEFFTAPASSTGRNHPLWQSAVAGILANTVECCIGIDRKMRMYPSLTDSRDNPLPEDRDVIYAATILSDTHKPADFGKPWDEWAHHRTAAEHWRDLATRRGLPATVVNLVYDAVLWHLGRFTPGSPKSVDPRESLRLHTFITHELDMDFSNRNLSDIFSRKIFKLTPAEELGTTSPGQSGHASSTDSA